MVTPKKSGLFDRSSQKINSAAKAPAGSELAEPMLNKRAPLVLDNLACDEDLSQEQQASQSQVAEEGQTTNILQGAAEGIATGPVAASLSTPSKEQKSTGKEVSEFQMRKFLMLKGFLGHLRQITDTLGSKLPEQLTKVT